MSTTNNNGFTASDLDRRLTLHQSSITGPGDCLFCGPTNPDRWYETFTMEQYAAFLSIMILVQQFRGATWTPDDATDEAVDRLARLIDPLADEHCGHDGFETICGDCVDNRGRLDDRINAYAAAASHGDPNDAHDRAWAARHLGCTLDVHEHPDPDWSGCPACPFQPPRPLRGGYPVPLQAAARQQ